MNNVLVDVQEVMQFQLIILMLIFAMIHVCIKLLTTLNIVL